MEDLEILDLTDDSRRVRPGSLFAALHGNKENGEEHIAEALRAGAVCVLAEERLGENVPQILVPEARGALALLASAWYGSPAERLTMVGVTGTNGKTTTTWLVRQLLERTLHTHVGLIGTNQNLTVGEALPAGRTTPGPLELHSLLARMESDGCTHVVMEVSSHALAQRRTDGILFDAAAFTNLTRDHLDYHGTMEAYCDAKARLFRQCRAAAVNGDSGWTERILSGSSCPVLRYGQKLTNDLVGWHPRYLNDRVSFIVSDEEEHIRTCIGIPGGFSLYNALTALALVRLLGVPLRAAAEALPFCTGVRGRCEVVPADADFTVLIDYAHTPDGLKNILETVCGFAENRVLAVFGCGGDRDRGKRARMGSLAAAMADLVVLTSDNPRTESPYVILHDILEGMRGSGTPFAVLEDRRAAIAYALDRAVPGDVVLLAGKGHETEQIVGTERFPLDERRVVREYFERRRKSDGTDSSRVSRELCSVGGCGQGADSLAEEAQGGAGDP